MDFEWDETKARTNEKKHDVSFIEAAEVFGVSLKGNFLVVSFIEKSDTVRIISARRMTNQERKAYER